MIERAWTDAEVDHAFERMLLESPELRALDVRADDNTRVSGSWARRLMPSGVPRWSLTVDIPMEEFAELVGIRRMVTASGDFPEEEVIEWGLRLSRIAFLAFQQEMA